ncbi:hypothetical protein LXA43DRAFT_666173 [Ganoderma leucocontextum]|nr:hypothetical protein LXA43DRAFT_666173 [Ganoderma leucocontextum]
MTHIIYSGVLHPVRSVDCDSPQGECESTPHFMERGGGSSCPECFDVLTDLLRRVLRTISHQVEREISQVRRSHSFRIPLRAAVEYQDSGSGMELHSLGFPFYTDSEPTLFSQRSPSAHVYGWQRGHVFRPSTPDVASSVLLEDTNRSFVTKQNISSIIEEGLLPGKRVKLLCIRRNFLTACDRWENPRLDGSCLVLITMCDLMSQRIRDEFVCYEHRFVS